MTERHAVQPWLLQNGASAYELYMVYKCYYYREHCLDFLLLRLKLYQRKIFLAITRQIRIHKTRFWKVLRQINAYVSNKWPLKLPCAYLNTQESRPTGTPFKRIQSG
ncbi:hypothetical protein T08_8159 [Trichinella sp. T8]|nr:hypothetical protein T08_8159 [Trichinella sp. T8]